MSKSKVINGIFLATYMFCKNKTLEKEVKKVESHPKE